MQQHLNKKKGKGSFHATQKADGRDRPRLVHRGCIRFGRTNKRPQGSPAHAHMITMMLGRGQHHLETWLPYAPP